MSKFFKFLNFFSAKNRMYKIYLDFDLIFYCINFNELNSNFVMEEKQLYDGNIKGIPAFLIFQNSSNREYEPFTSFQTHQLKDKQRYALLYYDYQSAFTTNTIAIVEHLTLSKIVLKKYIKDKS